MLFSSPVFLFLFLPAVLALYALCPRGLKNPVLLGASLVFYAWGEPWVVLVLLGSTVVNYALAAAIPRFGARGAHGLIAAAVAFDVGLLVFFKYANFLWENLGELAGALGLAARLPELDPIRLPIGVSFFTFQAMSSVIDVYRREGPPPTSFVDYALYKALFPQLIAGPIVRYRDVALQIVQRTVTRPGFARGVRRFVLGLGKKMLIANVVAQAADSIFALDPATLTAPVAWLGTLCYTLQIYFDFSGYSDMAIGLGLMFGFRFLENFDFPYVSRSITEFWRRWHISLSSWFRDYLYIPLGGSRRGRARTFFNLLVVFFLCGLWHGAAWTFVVWGLYHGAFLVLERALGRTGERRGGFLAHAYVLLVVMVGWVFFRAETLSRAFQHLGAMFGAARGDGLAVHLGLYLDPLLATALLAGAIGSVPWLRSLGRWREAALARRLASGARPPAWDAGLEIAGAALVLLVLVASAMFLSADTYNPFIYFQF